MDIQTDKAQLEQDIFYLLGLDRQNITRRLYHAVREMLESVRVNVEHYKNEEYVKLVEKKELTRLIHFELHLLKGRWFPIIRKLDKDKNPYKVIPQALIDYIAENAGENVIPWKKPLMIPGFSEPVYISYSIEKDDSTVIKGTIETADNTHFDEVETLPERKQNKQDDLQTLLEYIFKNQGFYESIMKDFFLKWKPLLDQSLEPVDPGKITAM